ncbi:LacI family DNA-binding transcriptional regulator [Wansuia hejianensis]|uniref:LacI family DNA-binding transcriptional regulator n=1 Tax=Wansuia hejianensis TaxID=2763667 RepID=A0A926ETJ4_9FIRM|nr:LacI family DNA-binding transcriptional regulator [Wansuia hejianensis]MBC8589533.1 LacI family DNA-binding transcriptional regulator [Wansuia hejianensis]
MSVTIKDVAKLAGVSISTVSRVINDSKPVSPEARRKVLHAIDELGYEPNQVARSLVTKKSNLIGVIVDDIGNYYVSQIVRGIEEIGRMYNYDIILGSSYGSEETEMKYLQLLRTKQVEGIILVSEIMNKNLVEYLEDLKIEFVYLNRYYNTLKLPTISLDNGKATGMMMDYLIELGHKNILYLTQEEDIELTIEKVKIDAYKNAMKSIGNTPIIHKINSHRIKGGYDAGAYVKELIDTHNISTVFCSQDELAIGLMNYFYDNDIKVPEDISVAGYGDISVAAIYRPTLTTIREPYYDIGAVAIRKILKKLIGESIDDENITLPIRLIKRESVKRI